MHKIYLLSLFILLVAPISGQIDISYHVNTSKDVHVISPWIYGVNGQPYEPATANRLGGNRMTGYNWENNASHAGVDWFHQNDDYLPWVMGIPDDWRDSTAIVCSTFQDNANSRDQFTLQTLPMAGYVAADKQGIVEESETAPSPRWNEVVHRKMAPFELQPDLTDARIYVDESINFLLEKFGSAADAFGINAYALDNEPALWADTHPRLHPEPVTVKELLEKSISLSKTIHSIDETAKVFGPVLYGFKAYLDLQDAPDWQNYSGQYEWFIDVYLDEMRKASEAYNARLLDVLDVHWYPSPSDIYDGDTSRAVAEARMQNVRSLWDSSYVEDSWIGQWFSPVALIPHLKKSIDNYYPGTELAFTEYDYGASDHISGAIAQVQALGVFGRYGVFFASKWNAVDQFVRAAFDIFLNYDGLGAKYGKNSVAASSDDVTNSNIYAAITDASDGQLHIILTNNNYEDEINATVYIDAGHSYDQTEVYRLTRGDTTIRKESKMVMHIDTLRLTLPALSVSHVVLSDLKLSNADLNDGNEIKIYPNPMHDFMQITSSKGKITGIQLLDMQGRVVFEKNANAMEVLLENIALPKGIYSIKITTLNGIFQQKIIVLAL